MSPYTKTMTHKSPLLHSMNERVAKPAARAAAASLAPAAYAVPPVGRDIAQRVALKHALSSDGSPYFPLSDTTDRFKGDGMPVSRGEGVRSVDNNRMQAAMPLNAHGKSAKPTNTPPQQAARAGILRAIHNAMQKQGLLEEPW